MMATAPVLDLRRAASDPALPSPVNLEAEQALLGAVLYDNATLESLGGISPRHFSEPGHVHLFGAIRAVVANGERADCVTVRDRMKASAAFEEMGGAEYLANLVDRAPPTSVALTMARVVADQSMRRDILREMSDVAKQAALDPETDALGIVADAERRLAQIASDGPSREAWRSATEVIVSALDTAQSRDGCIDVGTGLTEVDDHIGGFGRGELSIIAGRPGMFKSGVASQIAKSNAARGKGTVFFSQEMGIEPLGLRLACDLSWDAYDHAFNPTFDKARRNKLTAEQWGQLREAAAIVAEWPLLFDVRPGLTVSNMEACARRAFRQWERRGIPRGPVIIDHLGIVRPEKDRQGSKHAEVADVSRALAEMAKRLDAPVIALCQLNRGVESRDDKRPMLSDLRQAGEIEEDARLVAFLYRPEYYFRPPQDPGSETAERRVERETKLARNRNKLLWLVEKNNNGPLGQIETFCDVACSAVRDRAETWSR
ncbi:MAG: replicative DNA helicase [Caulobacteraceae bacterium]